jgi:hypothetical protein
LWTEIGEIEMAVKLSSKNYQNGLKLAESGRHEEAFGYFRKHLESYPSDGQAWNDAGTVLYCLGQIDEAIKYFSKARGLCSESELAGVYWNLCEAYIDGGYPELATGLFDEMGRFEILNADCFNRTANMFLEQGAYGSAIEMLLRSLSISDNQEILHPMIEVIRSKRVRVAFFTSECSERLESIFNFVKQRFVAELHIGSSVEEVQRVLEWCDIAWFDGCDGVVEQICRLKNRCKVVVRAGNDEVYEGRVKVLNWDNVDVVVLGANPSIKKAFLDSVGNRGERSRYVTMDYGVNIEGIMFKDRERGKNIACVCDLSLRSNPMFLLHCMQKLHYLDPGYRLHVAGQFADSTTERYVNHIAETLGLSEVVMFEGRIDDLSEWFSDKHYIVWTGMGGEGLGGILKGMASGLKPLVHNFPGSCELLDSQFVFNLSEDFCSQVMSDSYEPKRYRDFVAGRYGDDRGNMCINDALVQLEKEIIAEGPIVREEPVNRVGGEFCEVPVKRDVTAEAVVPARPVEVQAESFNDGNRQKRKIIPIKPLGAEHVQATPVKPHEADYGSIGSSTIESKESGSVERVGVGVSQPKGIEETASEALEASRALSEMINQYASDEPSGVGEISNVELTNNGCGATSPEIAAAEDRLGRMVSEFCEDEQGGGVF